MHLVRVLKLCIGRDGTDEEGWIYAQSVDRPGDLGWASAQFFIDVPAQYYPERLAVAFPEIEHSQVFECIRQLSQTEEQLRIVEARAREAEQRAAHVTKEYAKLQHAYEERLKEWHENEWRQRAMEAEKRVKDLKLLIRTMEQTKDNDSAQLAQKLEETVCSERALKDALRQFEDKYERECRKYIRRLEVLKELHPALHHTVKRVAEGDLCEQLTPNSTRRLPVLALRWSHGEINRDLCFGNSKSMFHTLELLMREQMTEDDWRRRGNFDPPNVVQENGKLFVVTANRRLTVLMLYQALNRDRPLEVTCKIESLNNTYWRDKFYGCQERPIGAKSTHSDGLSVAVRRQRGDDGAMHNGYPLFHAEYTAYCMMSGLLQGAPGLVLEDHVDVYVHRRGREGNERVLYRKWDGKTLQDSRFALRGGA